MICYGELMFLTGAVTAVMEGQKVTLSQAYFFSLFLLATYLQFNIIYHFTRSCKDVSGKGVESTSEKEKDKIYI